MTDAAVARCILAHQLDITSAWSSAVAAQRPELDDVALAELNHYLPHFLEELAELTGTRGRGTRVFLDAARQHAEERMARGASLEQLRLEYAVLRKVVLEQLRALGAEAASLDALVRLNEALDQATELAVRCYDEQRSSQGERFVRLLGHDLRNPLNAASIAAEALTRSEALSDRGQKRLTTISRANARMGRLIENMLDFARSYFGGVLPLVVDEGDWGEVSQSAFDEVQSEHPDRDLRFACAGELRGTFDRERVRQALFNLLAHALERGADPTELAVEAEQREGNEIIVTRVKSHGEEEPPSVLSGADPLAEGKGASGSNARLGLFVTALIARAHGATCEVVSEAGCFSLAVVWPRALPSRP
jgi:signal transduction histidine kinase